jgi:hypothetical protein
VDPWFVNEAIGMVGKHTHKRLPVGSKDLQASVSTHASSLATRAIVEDHPNPMMFGINNVHAMIKSNAILYRGVRGFNCALVGMARMTADDGIASAKALVSCRSIPGSIGLQTELAKLNSARVMIRVCVLSRIALQAVEEAACPLIRRMQAGVEQGIARSAP